MGTIFFFPFLKKCTLMHEIHPVQKGMDFFLPPMIKLKTVQLQGSNALRLKRDKNRASFVFP